MQGQPVWLQVVWLVIVVGVFVAMLRTMRRSRYTPSVDEQDRYERTVAAAERQAAAIERLAALAEKVAANAPSSVATIRVPRRP